MASVGMLESFRDRIIELANSPGEHWASHGESDLAALAIFFVGCCCVFAMFYHSIRDTVLERIAFAFIALGAFSRAIYIFSVGEIPLDGAWLCYALAFYCAVIIWKHIYVIPRRPDYKPPEQMPHY